MRSVSCYPAMLLGLSLTLILPACGEELTGTFGPDAPGYESEEEGDGDGNGGGVLDAPRGGINPPATYTGQGQAEVRYLLSKFTWTLPRDSRDQSHIVPNVPMEPGCIRDTYVAEAVTNAWAAEAHYRFNNSSEVAQAVTRMKEALNKANALCSNSPGFGGQPTCRTLNVWGCPPPPV